LGKVPTYEDIRRAARQGKCAGYKVFRARCGTLEQLRKAAGLVQGPRRKYTRQQLIDQLKKLAAKLGRSPLATELIAASRRGECATIETLRSYFGTYNKALVAAGLATRPTSYSRAQLIQMLQALAKKLGHRPTVKEINESSLRGEGASAATYDHRFGKMSTAMKAAKLDALPRPIAPRKRSEWPKRYTREEMQEQLKRLTGKLRRAPKQRDVTEANRMRECAGITALALEFGSFTAALRSIGLDVRVRQKEFTRNELIEQLRQLTRELHRLPMTGDINRSRACATPETFIRRFVSLIEARKAAGLHELLEGMGVDPEMIRRKERAPRPAQMSNARNRAAGRALVAAKVTIRRDGE
jgi:hypothetical protein